jgi:hypothetical protein
LLKGREGCAKSKGREMAKKLMLAVILSKRWGYELMLQD